MAVKGSNAVNIFKSIYRNEFQWAFIKSFGIFILGVRIAKEFAGVDIMPSIKQ